MKWLEIIEVRTGMQTKQNLQRSLQNLLQEVRQDQQNPKIWVYQSYNVESDYSIHLMHDQHKPDVAGSVLGMRITDSLKPLGLVNHHIWCEMKNKKENNKNL